jgi:hypothetical protein
VKSHLGTIAANGVLARKELEDIEAMGERKKVLTRSRAYRGLWLRCLQPPSARKPWAFSGLQRRMFNDWAGKSSAIPRINQE